MNKIIKKERILVERSKILKIMKEAGCGQAAVYNALSFKTDSKLADKVRNLALNRFGGIRVKEAKLVSR